MNGSLWGRLVVQTKEWGSYDAHVETRCARAEIHDGWKHSARLGAYGRTDMALRLQIPIISGPVLICRLFSCTTSFRIHPQSTPTRASPEVGAPKLFGIVAGQLHGQRRSALPENERWKTKQPCAHLPLIFGCRSSRARGHLAQRDSRCGDARRRAAGGAWVARQVAGQRHLHTCRTGSVERLSLRATRAGVLPCSAA